MLGHSYSFCVYRDPADIRTVGYTGYCLILNTNWKFNSKQSSTRDLVNKILHLFKHLSSVKGVYQLSKSDNYVLYCVASQIWQLLQHGIGSQARLMIVLPFQRRWQKRYALFTMYFECNCLSLHTTIVSDIKNYPSTSMSCCSDDLAQLLPCIKL